jgi:hypothetical protein
MVKSGIVDAPAFCRVPETITGGQSLAAAATQ